MQSDRSSYKNQVVPSFVKQLEHRNTFINSISTLANSTELSAIIDIQKYAKVLLVEAILLHDFIKNHLDILSGKFDINKSASIAKLHTLNSLILAFKSINSLSVSKQSLIISAFELEVNYLRN